MDQVSEARKATRCLVGWLAGLAERDCQEGVRKEKREERTEERRSQYKDELRRM